MAKVKKQVESPTSPKELTMSLFKPGMTAMHRAGLGGLAATLRSIEKAYDCCALLDEDLPGWPWPNGKTPWEIGTDTLTLDFEQPDKAEEFLKKLFKIAFAVKDGVIYLPGQYASEPNLAVRADLQLGLTLTFLQHGKVRKLAKQPTVVQHDPDESGVPGVCIEFRACSHFTHQDGWQDLVEKGYLKQRPIVVVGALNPGAMVRHVAFTRDTGITDTPDLLLPLYFAPVGCLALPVNRGVAALIVPEVVDLKVFAEQRPLMTPTAAKQCQIANAADGAMQAQIRLRNKQVIAANRLPGCYAMTFRPTTWASQQKSRVAAVHVPPGDEVPLRRFEVALADLPAKIVTKTVTTVVKSGKKKTTIEEEEASRVNSIVRPLVANNLARGRPWYENFVELMIKLDPATNTPFRDKLFFEREGLHLMTEQPIFWDQDRPGELTIVKAVHEAMKGRYGQIADENRTNPVAMRNRFKGEYDRWRLAFAGAKTEDQFRGALCDLFSRAGNNKVLRESWQALLPMLRRQNWQLARDLALLALASYGGQAEPEESKTSRVENLN